MTCLGFEVRSDLAFRLLRPAKGRPLEIVEHDGIDLDVDDEPLMSWQAGPGNPYARQIYRYDGGYAVWHEAIGWFLVDPDRPSIAIPPAVDEVRREERTWGLPGGLCVAESGGIPLHASAVDVGGSAILFSAPGGHGKTTMAAAFMRAGYRLLADDMSACWLDPEPVVCPGPAVIRLRRDVHERLELSEFERVTEDDEKVHLMLSQSARGSGESIPIAGIVFLRDPALPALEDRTSMGAIGAAESLANLWNVTFSLPTSTARQRTFQKTAALADQVSIWEMHRAATFDELPDAVDAVIQHCVAT